VGRLSREKDHLTLLHAFRQLAREGSVNAHLLIVGDGPERPRIEAAIRDFQLCAAVTMTGHMPSAEPYYGVADLAVLSSLSEGSPNALLEAMSARVPVVATAVGGVPEIVADRQSALLVPPHSPAALCQAMGELLTNQAMARALAQRAGELLAARHSLEARSKRLLEIYAGVLSNQLRYSS